MADITALILDDHETFRRSFAALDDAADSGPEELDVIWGPLADLLDVHAEAEEEIFYPQLLKKADPDGEETKDAIGDHNDIRDAVADARRATVGSDDWWSGVQAAREANSEHMAEEEREGLADFRRHAADDLREKLGGEFEAFKARHAGERDMKVKDKDPEAYVEVNS